MSTLPVEEPTPKLARRKRKSVGFVEKDEVINPEDVDSNVGRFRNMISVEIIPNKVQFRHSVFIIKNIINKIELVKHSILFI